MGMFVIYNKKGCPVFVLFHTRYDWHGAEKIAKELGFNTDLLFESFNRRSK